MRILFLSWRDLAHPQAGGSEVLVDRLASGLADRGHTVRLLAGGPVGRRDYEVVDSGGTYAQYLTTPVRYLRSRPRPDVVVDVSNGLPYFAPVWRRGPVVTLIHHVHTDQWAQRFPAPVAAVGAGLEIRAVPWLYRRATVTVSSPSTADDLAAIGVERERVTILPIGIDGSAAGGRRAEAAEPEFVALGRLVPHKRIDLLLDLWPEVRARVGGKLTIIGDGPDLERLTAMAPSGVTFTGRISDEERSAILRRAWVFVHPSHHEGWGIVIMEAAAEGVPAVGFDVAGVRDSIVDGVTGLVATDRTAFIEHWCALASDRSRRDQLGEQARERAGEFTWGRTVDVFEKVVIQAHESRSRR